MTGPVGLRERKKARIKLGILAIVAELLKENTFDEILVEQICAAAEISKVTFFKYFPEKDDILGYFMRIWCYRRTVEQKLNPIPGLNGLYHLFDEATKSSAGYPKARFMMVSLVSFLVKRQHRPEMFDLDKPEKMLICPDEPEAWELKVLTLDQLILSALQKAAADGEFSADADLPSITKALVSVFYGAPVSGIIFQEPDMARFYLMHLKLILTPWQ